MKLYIFCLPIQRRLLIFKATILASKSGSRDIYYGHFPIFWSKLKNREEFERGLHDKRKGKGGKCRKKKRVIKLT